MVYIYIYVEPKRNCYIFSSICRTICKVVLSVIGKSSSTD